MDEEWDDLIAIVFDAFSNVLEVILCSNFSHYDWVDTLQMRWISKDFTSEGLAVRVDFGEAGTKMVFHITRRMMPVGLFVFLGHDALELGEDGCQWLSNDIGKEVESASVRHAEYCLLRTLFNTLIKRRLQPRNKRFTTL